MLGLDNPIHLLFLLVILLLVFGAKRLPEIGSSLGSGLRGFKESITGESTHARLEQVNATNAIEPQKIAEPVSDPASIRPVA